jgi:hypothetical protein
MKDLDDDTLLAIYKYAKSGKTNDKVPDDAKVVYGNYLRLLRYLKKPNFIPFRLDNGSLGLGRSVWCTTLWLSLLVLTDVASFAI